ncbi:TrkH family potassium uptake protein [Glutamicibacter arilaitensis]|uniref:ATPase n=1 Tax=Glutamicibacter arilaitensis TaxID=256701 RepID=A0A2N7S3I5_9MICC|nr:MULTISPECIES: potassium transporter TrkG [Glutamicibacter]PMQ20716.1 ATPase [Glutamicibacter arilaitensis]HCJ55078.1 ATPase [Glutamicibacter sp.]HCM93267.1 ATPase [Glutamicibacter sp.]
MILHPFRRSANAQHNVLARPARAVAFAFAGAILVGGLLLSSPAANTQGTFTPLVDGIFTATSAICVTGLTVLDTATHYTLFGKIVILVLIQAGGLGLMLIASLLSMLVIGRIGYLTRLSTQRESSAVSGADVRTAALMILKLSLAIESMVAIILAIRFWLAYDHEPIRAIWHGVFHAVSAFNNAGFALYSNNLMDFVADPWLCIPISGAIILGGLGFPVLLQLRHHWRHSLKWSMNTRLVLLMTALLLIMGTVFITAMEWNNPRTLGNLEPGQRILAGFFHSVQTRTAGFNSIDIGAMHSASWLGMDVLMFIGGGPAGTAGGIKITTAAVLLFIMLTELRGETAVNILGKRLSRSVHRQAITVALLGVGAVFLGTMGLLLLTDYSLDRCLFEATSAFGTVGLSTGITPELPDPAKAILIALMYLGRVGVLSLGSALALRDRKALYELPKERPAIG